MTEIQKILSEWKEPGPPGYIEKTDRLIAALEVVISRPYYAMGLDGQCAQEERILAILKGGDE